MEKVKELKIALVIICLVIGFVSGFFINQIFEEDDDEGSGWDIFYEDMPYDPDIDPADFEEPGENPYYPLTPGLKKVYEGETEDGLEVIEVIVTNETKTVMGVECVVVRDTVSIDSELFEDTYDWFAADKYGNIWYFGEDSKELDDGEWDYEGSWEAGVDGALPGIIMLANPIPGVSFRQEYYEGEAEDMGAILSLNESVTVKYGSFDNVLVTRDWNPLEPEEVEHKYYAKGIGVIMEELVRGGSERIELIDITTK